MITCPNCGKENADESVHCGFCGHQLQEGGKKTMFGMAALNADELKRAAEAAKAASGAPAAAPPAGGPPAGDPFAKTEMLDSVPAPADAPPAKDPFADEFAALEAQYGDDASLDISPFGEPSTPISDEPSFAPPAAGPPASAPPAAGPPAAAPNAAPPTGAPGPMVSANNGAVEKKKNNTMLFVGLGVAALGGLGCIAAIGIAFAMGAF